MDRRFRYPFLAALLGLASTTPATTPQKVTLKENATPLEQLVESHSLPAIPVQADKSEPISTPAPITHHGERRHRLPRCYDVEDLLEYLRERDAQNPQAESKRPRIGDYSTIDGSNGNVYADAIRHFERGTEDFADEERRRRAHERYGKVEPWVLFVELRGTVDEMTRKQKMHYLATGQGPPLIDYWVHGVLPRQRYLDRVMGVDWGDDEPKNDAPAPEQITRRNNEPIREPTTGGKNAPITPEEEARLDEALAGLTPIHIKIPPRVMQDGTTRSHFESPGPEYNAEVGRKESQRDLDLAGGIDNLRRLVQLRSRRDAETTVFLHEKPHLLAVEDGIATVQSLHTFARAGKYEEFAHLIQPNVTNLPTRLVPTDSDFYKPLNEARSRQLFETLRASTIDDLSASAHDTGLGEEVGLITKIGTEYQELKLVVRKNGIVGVTVDLAFEYYGRWDLPEYTGLELAARTLEEARTAATSQDYERFLRSVQIGVETQPSAPEPDQFRPEPLDKGILERFYRTLAGALGIKTDVWCGDHGEGIQLHVNLQNGTQYIVAVRQNRIIGLSVFSGG